MLCNKCGHAYDNLMDDGVCVDCFTGDTPAEDDMVYEITRKVSYRWKRSDDTKIEDDVELQEDLDEAAESRMREMRAEGYASGELHTTINEVEYTGWWDVSSPTE